MRRRHVQITTYEYVVLDIDVNVYLDRTTLLPIHLCCRSLSILVNLPLLVPSDPRIEVDSCAFHDVSWFSAQCRDICHIAVPFRRAQLDDAATWVSSLSEL